MRNLQRVIYNSRYLIKLWVRIPNLASQILSEARRRLPQHWNDRYRVTPVLMETFVEVPLFAGAVYGASGWIHAGTTLGPGKHDRGKELAKPKKGHLALPAPKGSEADAQPLNPAPNTRATKPCLPPRLR